MRIFFTNLGCKLNQAEIEGLARQFTGAGHVVVDSLEAADLHVVNSCTVTHVAARDSRKAARRGGRARRDVKTVLTGCHVDAAPEESAQLAGVDLVVPNASKHLLLKRVEEEIFPEIEEVDGTRQLLEVPYVPIDFGNTRSLVKVEDGCNMRCSFRIIPATRGRQRSRSLEEVVADVESLLHWGAREIVVTGVQISAYRWENSRLFDLVRALLERTDVPRLRLTSIAPWQFDRRLLDLLEDGRVCRHFHLSLQSGCNDTLRRMRRPYSSEDFARLVEKIRARDPETAITTDIIVGFPGETDASFERSLSFAEEMAFARIHAFPYSPRPHTEAADLSGHVPHETRRERMRRMLDVARRAERRYWTERLGSEAEVLWEAESRGLWLGMTDNYIRVTSRRRQPLNELCVATLQRVGDRGVEVARSSTDSPQDSSARNSPSPINDPSEIPYRAEDSIEARQAPAR